MIPAWVTNETKDLTPFIEESVSNWTKRSELVLDYGILTSKGVL